MLPKLNNILALYSKNFLNFVLRACSECIVSQEPQGQKPRKVNQSDISVKPIQVEFKTLSNLHHDISCRRTTSYLYLPTYLHTYLPTTMDQNCRQQLHLIQKQMMMIVSLLVVAIAIILAPDEAQLA